MTEDEKFLDRMERDVGSQPYCNTVKLIDMVRSREAYKKYFFFVDLWTRTRNR